MATTTKPDSTRTQLSQGPTGQATCSGQLNGHLLSEKRYVKTWSAERTLTSGRSVSRERIPVKNTLVDFGQVRIPGQHLLQGTKGRREGLEDVHNRIEAQPDSERSPSFLNRAIWISIRYFETDRTDYLTPSPDGEGINANRFCVFWINASICTPLLRDP
jgi:hypothetical protein